MLPFDKKTNWFYKYFFRDIEAPLIIQAPNRAQADVLLSDLEARFGDGQKKEIENIKIVSAVYGVTEKTEAGVTMIWVGLDESASGWQLKSAFKNKYE